jgi:hypothetical protein
MSSAHLGDAMARNRNFLAGSPPLGQKDSIAQSVDRGQKATSHYIIFRYNNSV